MTKRLFMEENMIENDKIKNNMQNSKKDDEDENKEVNPKDNVTNFGMPLSPFSFDTNIQYVSIIGHIEGHNVLPSQNKTTKYEHIIPQLIAVEENPKIKGLFIILNTVGGDVEAGLAISELIATISKPTVSIVLGGGHSIGVPLATSSDYSFIAETASMTLHPIRYNGLVIGAEQTYKYFRKMQDRIINFIVRTAGIDKKIVVDLMNETDEIANDVGTILIGKEAVDIGLINEVGGLKQALAKLKGLIEVYDQKQLEE